MSTAKKVWPMLLPEPKPDFDPGERADFLTNFLRGEFAPDITDAERLAEDPDYGKQLEAAVSDPARFARHMRSQMAFYLGYETTQKLEKELPQTCDAPFIALLSVLKDSPTFMIEDVYVHNLTTHALADYGCNAEICIKPKNHGLIQFTEIPAAVSGLEEQIGCTPSKRRIDWEGPAKLFSVPAIFYDEHAGSFESFRTKIWVGLCDKIHGGHISYELDDPCRWLCAHKPYCGFVDSSRLPGQNPSDSGDMSYLLAD
jgi:hypothetical protein